MPSPTTHNVVWPKIVTAGDAANPELKTFWVKMGVAWDIGGGRMKIQIDATPLGWDGQIMLFPVGRGDGEPR